MNVVFVVECVCVCLCVCVKSAVIPSLYLGIQN